MFHQQNHSHPDRARRPAAPSARPGRLCAHLSFANVAASLALFIALGGTATAAVALDRDSVGAPQIRTDGVRSPEIQKDAVRGPEIAPDAVRGPEIADDGVGASEIAPKSVGASELKDLRDYRRESVVLDGVAHDGVYGRETLFLPCGNEDEQVLGATINWTDTNGANEAMLSEVILERGTSFESARLTVVFDGGGNGVDPARFTGKVTCFG